MSKVSYAVKIDSKLVKEVKEFCAEYGIKQGFLVEKALRKELDRKELIDDLLDLKNLRSEEVNAISFEEYLKKRSGLNV